MTSGTEWGGPLGAPRDWYSSVGFDRSSGLAWAGGYVGDGVSTANLAGRTLRDLVLDRDTDIVGLAWVHHRSRRWEPEPLRWIGTNLALKMMASADHKEVRTGKPERRTQAHARADTRPGRRSARCRSRGRGRTRRRLAGPAPDRRGRGSAQTR